MRPLSLLALLLGGCLMASAQSPSPSTSASEPTAIVSSASPGITIDAIEKRLASLKAQYDQETANLNALQGAIADCQYWLDQLKALEKRKVAAPDASPSESK